MERFLALTFTLCIPLHYDAGSVPPSLLVRGRILTRVGQAEGVLRFRSLSTIDRITVIGRRLHKELMVGPVVTLVASLLPAIPPAFPDSDENLPLQLAMTVGRSLITMRPSTIE